MGYQNMEKKMKAPTPITALFLFVFMTGCALINSSQSDDPTTGWKTA